MRKFPLACFFALLGVSTTVMTTLGQQHRVVNLKVDLLQHPMLHVVNGYPVVGDKISGGNQPLIANKQPAFGWELAAIGEATMQSAYRIIVATNQDSLAKGIGDVWDSGKVRSAASTNVSYHGQPLQPHTDYAWQVMLWNQDDASLGWSAVGHFRTAGTLHDYQTAFYPLQKTDEVPESLRVFPNEIRADFGKASFGQLQLTLTSSVSTDTLTVRLGEAINADGTINRKPGGTIRYAEYQLPLQRGQHTYQLQFTPNKRNTGRQAIKMPAYIGEVLPFRYVELQGYARKVEPGDIVRATVHYPFDDFASHFESSDSVLNAVWELCKYSIKATSFAGIYVDGDRERIPYEADAYINQLGHYGVDKEYTMARRSHEYLLHHATWPTEWILQSVLMAYNDYLYTGDIRSVEYHYDDLKAKLLLPLREGNGLISTRKGKQTPQLMEAVHYRGDSLRDIVDWPHTGGFGMVGNGETDGFVFTEYNAVVNAFHYKALCDMAELAEALGREADAAAFAEKAEETYRAFQSLLWDNRSGTYRDGLDTDHASLHTNMMALAFGLVPAAKTDRVATFIRSRGMACSVYGSQFLMDAIYAAGDADYGLSLLTSQDDRSWYNMIRAGSTITMEAWDNKYKPNQDWNHAWGAVPANTIPRKLMGVEPLQPGWAVFRVRPQIGSLAWAKAVVPTIRGSVLVSCRQESGTYTLELTVPGNSTANVQLPYPGKRRPDITVNGESVRVKHTDGWLEFPPLTGGNYQITVDLR
ncbi:alpha-L-rhamnosidase C-terminal domain-containing protein [Parapedobacter sp. 10938]|uniref:alpha-L-rhamnosidase-related protein n=1 Tax=Parapedobacter flavus TaxID=3110225 RepID=UPI002DBFEDC0|nr:alpha-L-rhamnosidase C-terminal domain-containing protein [Parapedobacter sp. 10938]MEC3880488.1 alpha-L-rhamnosidase C-terminal domain-containing protein [Parapedobacter sp. 10938]